MLSIDARVSALTVEYAMAVKELQRKLDETERASKRLEKNLAKVSHLHRQPDTSIIIIVCPVMHELRHNRPRQPSTLNDSWED
jgi:hypothetical protein